MDGECSSVNIAFDRPLNTRRIGFVEVETTRCGPRWGKQAASISHDIQLTVSVLTWNDGSEHEIIGELEI